MNLINPQAEAYAVSYTSSLDALQKEVLHFTMEHHPQSHMISGGMQGMWLSMLSKMLRPRRILEIGTFTGFSGLCLAEGLQYNDDGLLYTLELRNEDAEIAQSYFDRSMYKEKIKLIRGNAAESLTQLNEIWDLVFIDADKTGYCHYFDLVFPNLAENGIIVADNVLFHGEILQEKISGKNAKAIAAFNEKIKSDKRIEHCLLTIRDGLMVIRKR